MNFLSLLEVAYLIALGVASIFNYLQVRSKKNESNIDSLEEHIEKLDKRIVAVEAVNSSETIKHIYEKIDGQSQQLNKLTGAFNEANSSLKMISQYLMTKDKK